MKTIVEPVDIFQDMFIGLLKSENITLKNILIGLHNACISGEHLDDNVYNMGEDDKNLKKLFRGLDIAIEAATKMED